jgi:hypothetical protein
MKKVLLTTTALALTAGVASAEITFSGSGEAGFYRTAPTAAVAAVTGYKAGVLDDNNAFIADGSVNLLDANDITNTGAAQTAHATEGRFEFVDGNLNFTAATTATASVDSEKLKAENDVQEAKKAVAAAATGTALAVAQAQLEVATRIRDYVVGSAAVAKGATPKLKAYSGYDFNVAASGASDNGMTFAMGFDMGAGHIADQDDDRAMDAQGGTIDTSAATIGYAGYTIEIGDEKVDDTYDADGWNGDVSIAGSLGDLTFKLVTDMDDDVAAVAASTSWTAATNAKPASFTVTEAVAAEYNPTSYSLGYTMGNIAFSMAGTEHDARGNAAAKMSLAYTVSDSTTVTLDSDNLGTYKDVAKVSLKQKLSDAMTITASIKDDKDHALNTNKNKAQSSDISIAYTSGALSSTLATDEGSNWWVNAQYDLGGGAQAFTTFDHTEFLVAGVNFSF